jgi:Glycosyl transferase family 2
VRHNLTILDGMLVVDHNSTDRTPAILTALCAERLPLVVKRHEAPGYLQAEITTSAAREVFARTPADFVFPLDADEFLKVGSRAELERYLGSLPPDVHPRFDWPTYVPTFDGVERDIVACARAARRMTERGPKIGEVAADRSFASSSGGYIGQAYVEKNPRTSRKVAAARSFVSIPGAYIGQGNHEAYVGNDPRTARRLPMVDAPSEFCIAHLPARSAVQHTKKFGVRRLARMAAGRNYPPISNVYQAFAELRAGRVPTPDDMLRPYVDGFFVTSGAPPPTSIETVEDPFIADILLRYTPPPSKDALPTVLAAVEGLTRRLATYRKDASRA